MRSDELDQLYYKLGGQVRDAPPLRPPLLLSITTSSVGSRGILGENINFGRCVLTE